MKLSVIFRQHLRSSAHVTCSVAFVDYTFVGLISYVYFIEKGI
jgi:hypothetical protein